MYQCTTLRAFAGAALLTAALAVSACGDDDDTGAQSAKTTTAAPAVKEVAFSSSPEDGLPTSYPPPKRENLTIGLLSPTGGTEVLRVIYDAAQKEVEQLGGRSILLEAELNPDTQVSQFQQLIDRKVDAIVLNAIAGPNMIGPLLRKAAAAKIPVIGIDVTPGKPGPVPGFASQVWHQRDRLTYLQVKAAAEALGPGGKVALIGFGLPVPMFQYTVARQRAWAKQFGLEVVDQEDSRNDTTTGGERAAAGLLAEHPDLDGILGYNDEPAIGAALAARSAGKRDLKTFGITGGTLGRSSLENDRLAATVHIDAADIGVKAVQGAYDAAQGTKIPPVVLAGDPVILTKDGAR